MRASLKLNCNNQENYTKLSEKTAILKKQHTQNTRQDIEKCQQTNERKPKQAHKSRGIKQGRQNTMEKCPFKKKALRQQDH